ncbi:MAG: ParA family protein [Calditrichaeota bacterium]|jgi:chromosome partitioning protein|nr:ParA family protein [Calditrichota bacterium]
MSKAQTLVFHSFKGGTGKTTLVANISAILASRGFKVCLFDFDLYAPSMVSYFKKTPDRYVHELLAGTAEVSDVFVDMTNEIDVSGELFVGFSSPRKSDIQSIEGRQNSSWQLNALRRFIAVKEQLLKKDGFDYILIDTSPGIRYWSISALALADMLLVLMKTNDMDILGTKKMIEEIYDTITRSGSEKKLILNKVPGASPFVAWSGESALIDMQKDVEDTIGLPVLTSIPCYCDVQFNRHEYLSSIKLPDHPFAKRINNVVDLLLAS